MERKVTWGKASKITDHIQRVCNPESNEIEPSPLAALWFD
jgi:hypothetical protein